MKKVFLKLFQNSQENNCARVPLLIQLQVEACNFIKNDTLTQVLSCEFCEILKNTFFTEHFWTTASDNTGVFLRSVQKFCKETATGDVL